MSTSSPAVEPPGTGATESSKEPGSQQTTESVAPRHVLIIRCCRMPEFEGAIRALRIRYPYARFCVLTQPEFRSQVASCSVDEIIESKRARYGVLRTSPRLMLNLRRRAFDLAVIPTMDGNEQYYANVMRMIWAIGVRNCLIAAPHEPDRTHHGWDFTWLTLRTSASGLLTRLDVPFLFLALIAAYLLKPLRRGSSNAKGPLRILHIMGSLGAGGAQRQMAELIARTPQNRFQVHVLVLGSGDDGNFARAWLHNPNIPVRFLSSWPSLIGSVVEIWQYCREMQFDLVHCWLFLANVMGATGARLARTPRVITSVRNLSLWKRTWQARPWYRLADALTARISDDVTVNGSPLVKDHAGWAFFPRKRIRLIPNGIDIPAVEFTAQEAHERLCAELGLSSECLLIGTVGRLAPEKDHLTYLRIMQRLRPKFPNLRGLIVGEGPRRLLEMSQAKELGLEDMVIFLGLRKDVREIVAGFDVFLLSSIIEGFSNALHEAVLLGVPCVSTSVGAAQDVLVEDKLLFSVGDVNAGASRVEFLLTHQAESRQIGEFCRRRAQEEFSVARMAERWHSLYEGGLRASQTGSPARCWNGF